MTEYIDSQLANLVTAHGEEAKPTAGFQRVLQRAAIHVQSSGREEVTGANVLVALFSERESHAVYFLQEQNMSRLDAVNFISQPEIGGLTEETAGKYLSYYWGGAMVGRFIGALVMRYIRPGKVLAFNAFMAIVLLAIVMLFGGKTAMWALLAIGLFNSIMFPTIFTLAIERLGPMTEKASSLLVMAIVGGAVIPPLQGWFVDVFKTATGN